jgi:hypothetical protein
VVWIDAEHRPSQSRGEGAGLSTRKNSTLPSRDFGILVCRRASAACAAQIASKVSDLPRRRACQGVCVNRLLILRLGLRFPPPWMLCRCSPRSSLAGGFGWAVS